MKIGIITFWNSQDNYGQIAQLFAMQTYLRKLGHEPFLIKYTGSQDLPFMYVKKNFFQKIIGVLFNPTKIIAFYNNKKNIKNAVNINKIQNRSFDDFRDKYIVQSKDIYSSITELKNNPPLADAYICGSDMIWNEFVSNQAYMLDFGDREVKRIAFAPSFAKKEVSKIYVDKIKNFLSNFDFIGVREKSGIDICKSAGFDNAEWVPDPTMLLSPKDYLKHFDLKDTDDKYVFVYLLGYELELKIEEIVKFAKERNLKIKYVASQFREDSYEKIYPSMEDWFENIKNAEFVFTNSFHCCVISLIFNRKFLFIPLLGHTSTSNERIHSLFEDFRLEREYKGEILKIEERIDWDEVNQNFYNKKQKTDILLAMLLKK